MKIHLNLYIYANLNVKRSKKNFNKKQFDPTINDYLKLTLNNYNYVYYHC